MTKAFTLAGFCVALTACSALAHSAQDYEKAARVGNPEGSLTTIVGPDTAVLDLTGMAQFPQGDTGTVHSVLVYDRPGENGTCLFHVEYAELNMVTKEPQFVQPCDGKRWARVRVGGIDAGFVAHLHNVNYKGTPVTLMEIGSDSVPDYIHVVY